MIEKEYLDPALNENNINDTDSLMSFKTAQDVLNDLNLSRLSGEPDKVKL